MLKIDIYPIEMNSLPVAIYYNKENSLCLGPTPALCTLKPQLDQLNDCLNYDDARRVTGHYKKSCYYLQKKPFVIDQICEKYRISDELLMSHDYEVVGKSLVGNIYPRSKYRL
jgi:hypothetical protein